MTDLAYDRYGMRVQWTLFGGAPFTPAPMAREALVDRFAALASGREHKIFAFEIAMRPGRTAFAARRVSRSCGAPATRLNGKTGRAGRLSSPQWARVRDVRSAGADAMTLHYERGFGRRARASRCGGRGVFPARTSACPGALPAVVFNNEPIGPETRSGKTTRRLELPRRTL